MTMTLPDHENKPESLGTRLLRQLQEKSGQPLIVSRHGLRLPAGFETKIHRLLEQLEKSTQGPIVLTALSNAVPDLNPYSGLLPEQEGTLQLELCEELVNLLGPGIVHRWRAWPDHLALFSAQAVEVLSKRDTHTGNVLARLHAAGGKLLVADSLFLHDPEIGLFDRKSLEPHEQRRPPAWGILSDRLDNWSRDSCSGSSGDFRDLEDFCAAEKPLTLHITHSWGGGVAQWVGSFVEADETGVSLQLRSESPESGRGCGQRYSLYLANRLETPIASWWLQPPILSTDAENSAYRGILRQILSRYGVGRIIVSSLVGHSLEALSTGAPTIQVLHDFYPRWPLLGIHPGPYLEDGKSTRLEKALGENSLLPELRDRDASGWEELGKLWRESVVNYGVSIVAPSRSVADLLRRLDPAWSDIDIDIIPHGLPPLPGSADVLPRDREDDRLRLVIPGRIQHGKGQRLLLEALPELTKYAQVYLLGAGRFGEAFFGQAGVDVIIQYRRDELRKLLATIGPHVAALLSIVPETFSYTLSEMQQLNIPVIGTRVGSLEERISDGETGWLIETDAHSLIKRVRELADDRDQISAVRERLKEFDLPGAARMVSQYGKTCLARPVGREVTREPDTTSLQESALAFQKMELANLARQLEAKTLDLQAEVEKRSAWAEEREQARKEEKERRVRWVSKLRQQLDERFTELRAARDALDRAEVAHKQTVHDLESMLERLQAEHDWVLASKSWRFTKPFRIFGRTARNLAQAQAWNPLRWPLLLSQSIRIIKTRGLRGALLRVQLAQNDLLLPKSVDSDSISDVGDPTPPSEFPFFAEPAVSIVIPVHNKWPYTAACLRSLAETRCNTAFEVIVVDDQSSDETHGFLEKIKRAVVIRNDDNLGFIGSCNRGADVARGRFVVMLNNDTQVLDGWLDALIETFERYPDTGLAGARLVYPDGRLQEAGGIVFRDGSGWNYGKGDNADHPDYMYTREVDYCSGACMMLETSLFRELGGFDSHYAPAYYEDTDLAFRIRERGLKVRIQPAATIVHHEGITSGTDLNSGIKRYQVVNRQKFLDRWQGALDSYPEPIVDPDDRTEIRRARDHRLAGRVLIIDAYTPEPDQDSGSLRLRYLMSCFNDLGYGVTFLADNRTHAGAYTLDMQQAGIEVVYLPWIDSIQRFFSERGSDFHFVMISRHYVASKYTSLLKRHCPQARFLFDTVDLHFLREERQAQLENSLPLKRSAAQTRRSELAVINAADATLVVSPVEKTVLEEAAPDARVHVISNVHEVVGSKRPWADRKDIFFVGGYQHPPNIDAAVWFVGSIWPLIQKELPDVEFHLIGSKAPEQVRSLHGNGVRFHGFVNSMEPWLDGCRLAIAPLRYGAGIKGKVNMSMSHGQPVVATPMAVEGMFAKSGRDVLVAETPADFAAAVVRLYRDEDLWNRVSASGLENVRQYFSVETARLGLQELLKSLG